MPRVLLTDKQNLQLAIDLEYRKLYELTELQHSMYRDERQERIQRARQRIKELTDGPK